MKGTRRRRHLFTSACAAFLTLFLIIAPSQLRAQELRGIVMLPDGVTPAAGVVAVLIHAVRTDSIVARGVTNERGRFTLKPPAFAPTVLRLLRIGFEPMQGGAFALGKGEIFEASFTLHDNRVKLATFDVKASARCQVQPNGAQLVAQLFQQARTALIASTASLSGTVTTQAINYNRRQDRRSKLLEPVSRRIMLNETVKPYGSLGADSLDKVGYAVTSGIDSWYYAPDAEVLLSDKFLAQHCLHLVNGTDSLTGSIGIGFRPVAARRDYVDVQGTLWLDRSTSELQFLEYSYTSLPSHLRREKVGGRVGYAQLPNGGWFVNDWSIHMPLLTYTQPLWSSRPSSSMSEVVVSGYQITGGTVQHISVDDRVLYLNADAARAGTLAGDEQPGATVATKDGPFVVNGDSGTVRSFCGAQMTPEHEGLINGRVMDETGQPISGARIKAAWREGFVINNGAVRWDSREVTATSSSAGSYLLCGIAVSRTVSVFATRGEKWGRPTFIRVTEESPVAHLDLTVDTPKPKEKDAPKPERY